MKKEKKYIEYILKQAEALLAIDSPSGFTEKVTDYLCEEYNRLGYKPVKTKKGGVLVEIGGKGNAILTNKRNAELVYIARIEEPRAWPPSFADVLAWALAGELASARINDSQKQNWCYQNYEVALAKAAARDRAKQNPHRKQSPWLVARGNGPSELNNFGLLDGGE